MSETNPTETAAPAAAAPVPAPEPHATPPAPAAVPPPRRRRIGPAVATLLFLLLFAAVGWLWTQQQQLAQRLAAQPAAVPADQMSALQQRVDALAQQVTELQQRPAPGAAPVDLRPLQDRLAALEQRQTPAAPDLGLLTQKLDGVAAQAAAAQAAAAGMNGKIADLEQRLAAAEQQAGQLGARATQAQRIEQAQVALDDGAPLGDLPGAPPALARFAHARPPTEAALRLSFPAVAAAAERASRPSTAGKSFGERMWLRARSLITVKQGERVLVGAPATEVLGEAKARLDAGDLAGTLKALDGLDGPAAQAMAAWRGEAQALLDARAALAGMARG